MASSSKVILENQNNKLLHISVTYTNKTGLPILIAENFNSAWSTILNYQENSNSANFLNLDDNDSKVQVCKYYLVDFCPHDLFSNTRSNLGPCNNLHLEVLREQFQQANDPERTYRNGLQMQKENELRICDICGAMQSVGDTMARFESHVMGKQHIGFERIRACIARLKEKHAAKEKRFPHKNSNPTVANLS
uniref:Luc7-like protein n=1 Tax=Dermatophagoides pteronyssinus TaxID=6956 RepID=A0A6P6XPZ2_DERPT|nr:luc7-like protein [Dermatophagoides pteronyssinus]